MAWLKMRTLSSPELVLVITPRCRINIYVFTFVGKEIWKAMVKYGAFLGRGVGERIKKMKFFGRSQQLMQAACAPKYGVATANNRVGVKCATPLEIVALFSFFFPFFPFSHFRKYGIIWTVWNRRYGGLYVSLYFASIPRISRNSCWRNSRFWSRVILILFFLPSSCADHAFG